MRLPWTKARDPEDHTGARHVFRASVDDETHVLVSEVSAGDWGYLVTDNDGFPCGMRYSFKTPESAQEAAELVLLGAP